MPSPLREKNEIKIFILFLLDKIGYPLDYNTIGSIVVQDGIVRFFDFAEAFYELVDDGHVRRSEKDGDQLPLHDEREGDIQYEITETGREVAHVLGENLMVTVREQGTRSALRHLSLQTLGAAVDQSYENLGDGYLYHCSIKDKNGDVMAVDLRVDDRRLLGKIQNNFADKPEIIYRGILALLSGDVNYIFE